MTVLTVLLIVLLAVLTVVVLGVWWKATVGQRARPYDLTRNPVRPPGGGF